MRIVNKALDKRPIEFFVKDEAGNDISIKLGYYQFVFTPTKEKTRTINIHGRRGSIFIDFQDKPDFAEYFKPYTTGDLERIKAIIDGAIPSKQPNTSNKAQTDTNANTVKDQMVKEIVNTNPYDDLNIEKMAEEIPPMEYNLQDLFDQDLSEAGFEDEAEVEEEVQKKDPPKKKPSSKKGPGRPKKRGRPKKKKPRGRPPKKK